ncbi:hypothetical protein VMCG_05600 [Cytospora schulzeri]|uniref:Uncharacterized protein n=1 Tax=Cytospora schulzeri TaxID=448051 RepID=A0A423WF27_9PEZI|nr:hypothetical protein VMCG_05600 [Valsa malicola]
MDLKSPTSSYACYEEGVFDKVEAKNSNDEKSLSREDQLSPKIPKAALGCLVVLFIFSFITIITSGIVFSHGVASSNCLAQSWVMFSAIMGFLYICLHLQAARKGDPVNRARPSFQHPLHSSAIVVARIDIISWIISLLAVSVSISKNPLPISCLNLVACAFVTPNSHTQHAAAIAASTVGAVPAGGSLGGPRPPPASVKEARPWSFTKFDDKTKKQLAASVSEASHSSETRARVGGPRPLAASEIAVKTGVLPPPVCTEPKRIEMPVRERETGRERERQTSQELVVVFGGGNYPFDPSASIPRLPLPPPPAAAAAAVGGSAGAPSSSPTRAPTTARVRLQRAQDALKNHGRTMSGTVVLNRPQRLTGDRRGSVDDRMTAVRAPVRGGGYGEGRIPGSSRLLNE